MSDFKLFEQEAEKLLLAAGWLRFHDRADGAPKSYRCPLGALIIHSAEDRRDWEDEEQRPKPPMGHQVDQCMYAAAIVGEAISRAACTRKTRDQLWLISSTMWLSPDGRTAQFSDNGKLVGWLNNRVEEIAPRLPIKVPRQVIAAWSFGPLTGDDLQKRIRSRQRQAARLRDQVLSCVSRLRARQAGQTR